MLDTRSKAALADMLHNFAEASGDRDVLRAAKELLRSHGGREPKANNGALLREAVRRLTESATSDHPKKTIEILRGVARDLAPYEDRDLCAERIRKYLKADQKNQRK